MFTRDQSSRIKQEFWTTFGKYMGPVPSSEGLKINWINYHTHVKDLFFRMIATNDRAIIAISIEHNDVGMRDLYYEQFLEFQELLHEQLGEAWTWNRSATDGNGRVVSRIETELRGVSVLNKENWAELISFFKPRIIALDAFWENARYSFEILR